MECRTEIQTCQTKRLVRNSDKRFHFPIFQIEENLRLLYVGITRAKKKLFVTSAKKYKKYSKIINTKPSKLFQDIMTVSGVQNYE